MEDNMSEDKFFDYWSKDESLKVAVCNADLFTGLYCESI